MQEEPAPAVSAQTDDPRDPAAKARTFPTTSGVYLMKDTAGNVIYVGKAKNLRSRASSYFSKEALDDPRIRDYWEKLSASGSVTMPLVSEIPGLSTAKPGLASRITWRIDGRFEKLSSNSAAPSRASSSRRPASARASSTTITRAPKEDKNLQTA